MLKVVRPIQSRVIRVSRISAVQLNALQRLGYTVLMTYKVKGL